MHKKVIAEPAAGEGACGSECVLPLHPADVTPLKGEINRDWPGSAVLRVQTLQSGGRRGLALNSLESGENQRSEAKSDRRSGNSQCGI